LKSLVDLARLFAEHYHGIIDQRRKYTGDLYIVHPAAVVKIVKTIPHTKEMLAAAWLHDVVEDTPATIEEVRGTFGRKIALLVEMLTDVSRLEDGNRMKRKAIDRAHMAEGCAEAKTIKLADLIDNTRSIVSHDPKFAKVYLAEKALLLEVLRDGNSMLWNMAHELMVNAQRANNDILEKLFPIEAPPEFRFPGAAWLMPMPRSPEIAGASLKEEGE